MKDDESVSSEEAQSYSDQESSTNTSGTGSSGKLGGQSSGSGTEAMENKIISKEEQRAVRNARIIVFVVFCACAVAVSVAVYFFASASDQSNFEIEYNAFVTDIISLTQWEIQNNFALMASLSAAVLNVADVSNSTFPYLTDPNFEVMGGYVDGMSGIISVAVVPFVNGANQTEWEAYTAENEWWIEVGARLRKIHPQHKDPLDGSFQDHEERRQLQEEVPPMSTKVFRLDSEGNKEPFQAAPDQVLAPVWQIAPTPGDDPSLVNYDMFSDAFVTKFYNAMRDINNTVLSQATPIDFVFDHVFDPSEKFMKPDPHGFILEPIWTSFEPDAEMVGFIIGITAWENLFNNILPEGENGITCVVKDSCGQVFSYELRGGKPKFQGYNDTHQSEFDGYMRNAPLEKYKMTSDNLCTHELFIYPTLEFRSSYNSNKPIIYTVVVACSFLLTGIMFLIYDWLVNRRQRKTMESAMRTNAIVSSLFPANVRDRILNEAHQSATDTRKTAGLKSFLAENTGGMDGVDADDDDFFATRPIADLFPHTTVMFADIAGFTAWSSAREPSQVFTLLETVYRAFDKIAKMRRVYKVETVGDCYVAVCGLPDPCKDHAVVMARFARDCVYKMNELTKKLESKLGPDTADLSLRVGLHSGAVTAGVLRGDNARFQLFGDTMNTAARVESSGRPNMIHCSEETAELLQQSGKSHWTRKREDLVVAKGKGALTTYWVELKGDKAKSSRSAGSGEDGESENGGEAEKVVETVIQPTISQTSAREKRLIDWNVDLLSNLLKEIVARRIVTKAKIEDEKTLRAMEEEASKHMGLALEEVTEIICLPQTKVATNNADKYGATLPESVTDQLREYVSVVASMYQDNPFHNFEHASHVTMSVVKLLSRIVAPSELDVQKSVKDASGLHDHTYGITSDPLTQFSCVLSALIHDLDHPGVPNAQLIVEGAASAKYYQGKSVAEQNSIDLAWNLLMDDEYRDLRATIYANKEEFKRFRQLLVNSVMATDIMDKDLKTLRNNRWDKAFSESAKADSASSGDDDVNRKATIVIEHLIQASDVAHTMQHWHVYRKWNERFFQECYKAYKDGRAEKDPSENWYKGEIGFFDFYIIPLAKKLKDCGVFGVSSDEYLSYAIKNRNEWERRGMEMVAEMMEKVSKE